LSKGFLLTFGQLNLSANHTIMIAFCYSVM